MNIVITGGNFGIGLQTVRGLYNDGNNIIFGSRDKLKNEAAIKQIQMIKGGTVKAFTLDLSNFDSVNQFSQMVLKQFPIIDILINNAAIMAIPQRKLSKDGLEMQMATNHFGHFLLTKNLLPNIKKAKIGKIISVSSLAHQWVQNIDDINAQIKYSPSEQYWKSKLANVLFTNKLCRTFKQKGINNIYCFSLHPGAVATGLAGASVWYIKCLVICIGCCFKSPKNGALTSLKLARDPVQLLKNGEYYNDDGTHKEMNVIAREIKVQDSLWQQTQKLTKIKFEI